MVITVQFTRYFEELGFEDCDTKEFDNIKEANDFFNTIDDKDKGKKLFVGKDRIQ